MAEKVQVDTTKLRHAAGTMDDVTTKVTTIVNNLTNNLNDKGYPWGHDSYGDKFTGGANGYTTSSKNLLQGAGNLKDTLGGFGSGMRDAAQKLDDMDENNS
jgi:hypothetical protein